MIMVGWKEFEPKGSASSLSHSLANRAFITNWAGIERGINEHSGAMSKLCIYVSYKFNLFFPCE